MRTTTSFSYVCQAFFTKWLIGQKRVSPHTVAAYSQTFRLLFFYARVACQVEPSELQFCQLNNSLICGFLDNLESVRGNSVRSRNARLAALRSFFHFASLEAPEHAAEIQRVLAIPFKRINQRQVGFLRREEVNSILATFDQSTVLGRRNYTLILLAVQTGLRLSEITGLRRRDIIHGRGAHVRCTGKGRKERCTPVTNSLSKALQVLWNDCGGDQNSYVFTSRRNTGPLSADAVQHIVRRHSALASLKCPSLKGRNISPHVLRHTAAMEMLQAGVDRGMIALWLGHESLDTTQIYIEADLEMKREVLAKTNPSNAKIGEFTPDDELLRFLRNL